MGYVFDFKDSVEYDQWLQAADRQQVTALKNQLMINLLAPEQEDSVLEIGCGTGVSLHPLVERGIQVSGLDPSPYMLDIARRQLGNRVDLHRGSAESLPFDDNSFNHVIFMTTLEFVDDPSQALAEACRVAKDRLFIGILNRFALKGIEHRLRGIFYSSIYNQAQFFSVWEIKHIIKAIVGNVPVRWRTACQLPSVKGALAVRVERSSILQRCPFGGFVGLVATLTPSFKTRPLKLKVGTNHRTGAQPTGA